MHRTRGELGKTTTTASFLPYWRSMHKWAENSQLSSSCQALLSSCASLDLRPECAIQMLTHTRRCLLRGRAGLKLARPCAASGEQRTIAFAWRGLQASLGRVNRAGVFAGHGS